MARSISSVIIIPEKNRRNSFVSFCSLSFLTEPKQGGAKAKKSSRKYRVVSAFTMFIAFICQTFSQPCESQIQLKRRGQSPAHGPALR